MRIKVIPNTSRDDEFYAIKDRSTGKYLHATWSTADRNRCNWYGFEGDVARIARDRDQALKRFDSVMAVMKQHIQTISAQNPSRWKDENLDLLHRLLSGDLVPVRIKVIMDAKEYPA